MKKFSFLQKFDLIFRKKHQPQSRMSKLRLDKNERVSPFSKKFLQNFKKKINSEDFTKYPELNNLYKLVSKKLKISQDNMLLTSGSDIAIRTCFEVFTRPNSEVITISPTYGMVDVYAKIYLTKQKKILFDENLNIKIEKIIKKINSRTSLVVIANPNSPTGTIFNQNDLVRLIKKAREYNTYVLIDECYYDYSKITIVNKIIKFPNLIVCRSFSKSGLAGIRAGYLLSNKINISRLSKFRPMYELTSLSAKFLDYSLRNYKIFQQYINDVLNSKKYFCNKLKLLNLKFYESHANFILVEFDTRNKKKLILKELKKNNILVTDETVFPGNKQIIRFSIGPKKYMLSVLKIIKSKLNSND